MKFWLYPGITHSLPRPWAGCFSSEYSVLAHRQENLMTDGEKNIHCPNGYNPNDTNNSDKNKNILPLHITLVYKVLHMKLLLILS